MAPGGCPCRECDSLWWPLDDNSRSPCSTCHRQRGVLVAAGSPVACRQRRPPGATAGISRSPCSTCHRLPSPAARCSCSAYHRRQHAGAVLLKRLHPEWQAGRASCSMHRRVPHYHWLPAISSAVAVLPRQPFGQHRWDIRWHGVQLRQVGLATSIALVVGGHCGGMAATWRSCPCDMSVAT